MVSAPSPVLFVHGLWLHADSRGTWVDPLPRGRIRADRACWPGDASTVQETRDHPDRMAGHGIDDVVGHYAGIASSLASKPVVIAHSFGGLLVQRLLGEDLAAAAVAIDPAPIRVCSPFPSRRSGSLRSRYATPRTGSERSR